MAWASRARPPRARPLRCEPRARRCETIPPVRDYFHRPSGSGVSRAFTCSSIEAPTIVDALDAESVMRVIGGDPAAVREFVRTHGPILRGVVRAVRNRWVNPGWDE